MADRFIIDLVGGHLNGVTVRTPIEPKLGDVLPAMAWYSAYEITDNGNGASPAAFTQVRYWVSQIEQRGLATGVVVKKYRASPVPSMEHDNG